MKALRHYDELGLLQPAVVDPQSRYRYYSREQARDAVMIGWLRSLDLPLAVIRSALRATPEELRSLIEAETTRVEVEVVARQRTLLSLRRIAQAGGLTPDPIEIRHHPDREVARLSGQTDAVGLVPDSTALIYALLDELREIGAESPAAVFTINELSETEDRITVHACATLTTVPGDLRRADRARLPGGPFACLTHVGPYETLGLAHHALFAWVQEWGHEPLGPVWEFYVNDPVDVPPDDLITDVALPLDSWGQAEPRSP